MSNQLTLADSINAAMNTGEEATFIYNGTTYTFSAAGLIAFLVAEGSLPVGVTASVAEINTLDGLGVNVTIEIAASATTDGMDITVTVVDAAGTAVAAVHLLDIWMSEDADGIDLTGDTYSGDLTASVGTILEEVVAKKRWMVQTDDAGVFTATLVDSANPVDQYVVAKKPVGAALVVSEVSGTNWEGAA